MRKKYESPVANERFGCNGGRSPQKRQCKFERLYPAGSSVEAAAAQSRHSAVCDATINHPSSFSHVPRPHPAIFSYT